MKRCINQGDMITGLFASLEQGLCEGEARRR
jgi:hypothetical protein